MSSQFSTTGAGASAPAVCIPVLIDPPPPYVDAWPIGLDCFGSYWGDYAIVPIAETFRLTRNLALPGWSGESGNTGYNLTASITQWPSQFLCRCRLTLRDGTHNLASYQWYNVPIAQPPPFDTGLLRYFQSTPPELFQMQAQG